MASGIVTACKETSITTLQFPEPMKNDQNNDLLRLWKRHAPGKNADVTAADGERLVQAQSVGNAVSAALIVILIFAVLWAGLSELTNRVLPWMTMLFGVFLGIAIRRAGKGIDWRFPLLAAVFAVIGALAANIVVAAVFKAGEMDIGPLQVLQSATALTWRDFFGEVMTPADAVFAIFAAAIAAFYASPKLTRSQFLAVKLWRKEEERER
jgi:hypothetical protein